MESRTEALLSELRMALQQPNSALQQMLEAYAPQDLAEALSLMDSPPSRRTRSCKWTRRSPPRFWST
jgi:hypothetical protein